MDPGLEVFPTAAASTDCNLASNSNNFSNEVLLKSIDITDKWNVSFVDSIINELEDKNSDDISFKQIDELKIPIYDWQVESELDVPEVEMKGLTIFKEEERFDRILNKKSLIKND